MPSKEQQALDGGHQTIRIFNELLNLGKDPKSPGAESLFERSTMEICSKGSCPESKFEEKNLLREGILKYFACHSQSILARVEEMKV
jgi:hypothetical protein